ncbi:MAG: transcriptional repressor [Candidatus Marinimicrobia bacterium]|jgi:Fur family peroxide stress response transcriptional regulator|nr:transcriptional repressor [Candidatus Neomarinimicrobiota bacterium]MDD4960937.1 transcriptional repressor [Candidatus Neomarinimicrobiota bacterium]MDX9777762.1 transcriptional repressor [bacterium]
MTDRKQESPYRNTRQRKRIMELLRSTDTHPTANWVYDQLKNEFPSLSLGTVYRNLNILQEQGMLVRISSGSTFDRFDAVVEAHPHFRCRNCGKLYDIRIPEQDYYLQPGDRSTGHLVESLFIEYRGICASCLEDGKHLD